MPSISVIIPAYNVEKYLGECLDSIVNQTFDDLEIICVNDGSTDSTLDIFNDYASRDDRIRVISQENKGLSGARNTGLKNASGEYIYFIDSDDYLELDALEKLYGLSTQKNLDLVLFKLINVDDDTKEKYQTRYYDMDELKEMDLDVFSHRDIPEYAYKIAVSIPGKFFKRELIADMEFVEGIIFEDNVFFIEALYRAERIFFLDEYLYNRRVRQDSIITSNKNFTDYITVSNLMMDVTKRYGLYDDYKAQLFEKTITNSYFRFDQLSGEDKDVFFSELKKDYLAKKDEYDNDDAFQNAPQRIREIFYSAIESENSREFDLSIKYFDAESRYVKTSEELEELMAEFKEVRIQKNILFGNTKFLSNKINELSNENKKLKKEKRELTQENDDLKYVNAEALNSTSWKVTQPLRFAGNVVKK